MTMANNSTAKLSLFEKLFCFLIVWGSGTHVTVQYSYIYYAIAITFALIVFTGGFLFRKSMAVPIIVVFFLTLLSAYLNYRYMGGRGISSTFNNYIIILCSILFAMNKPHLNKQRIDTIIKVFFFFSFLSSILYVLFSLGLIPMRPVSAESHIETFLYLLNVAPSDLIDSVYRNGCIYWEPGMYQVFLNFILIYYLFNDKLKHRKTIIAYLVIVILTTISVSGYVLTILVFGVYAFRNQNKNSFYRLLIMIAILSVIIFLIPTMTGLLTAKEDTGSFGKRSLDLVLAWDVFLQHPLFGQGIVNDAYEKAYFSLVGELRPSSNGLMNLLMGTGVLGTLIYFYCYTRTLKFFSKEYSNILLIPLLLWLLISINTEPMQYQPFISFLFGTGLVYCAQSKVKVLHKNQMGSVS